MYQANGPCVPVVLRYLKEMGEVEGGDDIFGERQAICHIQLSS